MALPPFNVNDCPVTEPSTPPNGPVSCKTPLVLSHVILDVPPNTPALLNCTLFDGDAGASPWAAMYVNRAAGVVLHVPLVAEHEPDW